jgi:hypothetical protein
VRFNSDKTKKLLYSIRRAGRQHWKTIRLIDSVEPILA